MRSLLCLGSSNFQPNHTHTMDGRIYSELNAIVSKWLPNLVSRSIDSHLFDLWSSVFLSFDRTVLGLELFLLAETNCFFMELKPRELRNVYFLSFWFLNKTIFLTHIIYLFLKRVVAFKVKLL